MSDSVIRFNGSTFPITPNPPSGKYYVGVNSSNNHITKQLSDGSVIDVDGIPVQKAGSAVGSTSRNALNFIDGDAISVTAADNSGQNRTDLTFSFAPSNKFLFLRDDFIPSSNLGTLRWSVVTSGTAAAATPIAGPNPQTNPGVIQLETGTTAVGRADLSQGTNAFQLGGGAITQEWIFQIPTLTFGTETFNVRIGLGDTASGDHSNGAYFEYNPFVNSGNWQCKTAAGGTRTTTNTAVPPVAGAWANLTIVCNAAGTSVAFYRNGVLLATHTTNLPNAAGQGFCARAHVIKSSGTTTVPVYVDNSLFILNLTTAR